MHFAGFCLPVVSAAAGGICSGWMEDRLKIGISSCLLGNSVRYDGGDRRDAVIIDTLGSIFEFVPICPEVGCGLGVPRESMFLCGDPRNPRLVTTRTTTDHTERMYAWVRKALRELEGEGLHGFIFKSKSPSCGMELVSVYEDETTVTRGGVGIFARAFKEHFPLLPVEDEPGLHNPLVRDAFVKRVLVRGQCGYSL